MSDALSILSLPTLEHLSLGNLGDRCVDEQPQSSFPTVALPQARNVASLVLDSCHISADALTQLLAACPNLRTLTIKTRTRNATPSRAPCFAEALEPRGKGLEFLSLDTTAFDEGLAPEQAARFLRALASLDGSLRWLIVSRNSFQTVDDLAAALPRTVLTLVVIGLRGIDGELSPFRSLLRNPRVPALGRVVCLPGPLGDLGHSPDCAVLGRGLPTAGYVREHGGTVFQRPYEVGRGAATRAEVR
ncbi:hypothetical protein F5Y05DRAFT_422397 [Hypoxylon sp. FL0543]|nr:hypothetical protein F5Y05DRAFT_422397 [Hypoxylon sp. FL0543]